MNREYETHEVLKLIGENPTWKFQTIFSDGVIWEAFSRMDNKGVRCIYGKGTNSEDEDFLTSDSTTTMNRKWTKVKESVDFMTAVSSGRRIMEDVEPLIINKFADLKFKAYIYNLDMTVDVQRINFDTKTIEVLIGEDDFLHNDLCEYSFDEVDLIQEN